jgi:hypothetical protein
LEKLNHSRREHGRRLFTALFEPLLCRDGRFLDPQFTPPGYLHRIDVGVIWHVLSADYFPNLARTLKARLDILTAEVPIDQALESDEGGAMAEELRRTAVAGLDRVLASQGSCKDLLHRANIWRQENVKRANPATAVRPLMREDLALARAILTMSPDVLGMIRELVERTDRLDMVDQVMGKCASEVTGEPRLIPLAALTPLIFMHEYRDYRTAAYVLRNASAPIVMPVLDSFERHLKRSCREFTEALGQAVAIGGVMSGPLLVSEANRSRLNNELNRLSQLIEIYVDFDLTQNQRIGTASREHLNQMLRMVEERIFPVLLDRTVAASRSSLRPYTDHEDILWLLGVIWAWRGMVREQIQWGSKFTTWQDNLLGFLQESFKTALTSRNYDDVNQRWDHILRIDALVARCGQDTAGWLTPLDHAMVRIAIELLEDKAKVQSRAAELIGVTADLAEVELAQIKYWKDSVLLRFTELFRARIHSPR